MVALTHLALLASGAMCLVLPRDGPTIQSDLKAINTAYNNLQAANVKFGTDGNPIPVQNAVDQVELANVQAISDSALTVPLSDADVQALVDYVNQTLEPSIAAEIKSAVANKGATDKGGISIAVAIEMTELKSFSDAIGRNIVAKSPSKTAVSKVQAAFAKIDADYNQGIKTFSS